MTMIRTPRSIAAHGTGVLLLKWLSGVFAQRVVDDASSQFLIDDATGARIYAEINNG